MMAGLYVAAGVIPIVLYFLEVRKKSRSSGVAAQGAVEGVVEVADNGAVKKEDTQKPDRGKREGGSPFFVISSQDGFVTMSASVGPAVTPSEDIKLEPEVSVESSLLNTVWESQVLTSSDDGSPSFIIKAKASRDKL